MGIRNRHFEGEKKHYEEDLASPSVIRNPDKCILCGRCVRMCSEVQQVHNLTQAHRGFNTVVMPAYNQPMNESVCTYCGQCINRAAIGEAFGLEAGKNLEGQLVASLRKLGFDYVFDTQFAADLTIMEEGSEFLERVQNGGKLPMITSCSSAWMKCLEQFYPDLDYQVLFCGEDRRRSQEDLQRCDDVLHR
jgi:iron only hydrogenase large subunit-like protein